MNGQECTKSYLETEDPSFSLWNQEKVLKLFESNNLEILEWKEVDMPMNFGHVKDLLEFCASAPWFQDNILLQKALDFGEKLVLEELGFTDKEKLKNGFTLQNKGILIVTKKKQIETK